MKSMRSLYKKLFHYVPDKRILAYFSMALSAAAVCSYMGAYWFLWQSIVSILVIPVYEKAMYDAIIVVILMILRGILNIASATCSHYLGFRLETNLRKNGLHKLLDASSSFFDHNSSGEIRKIIDDNAAETHKTVAHLIPDNVTAVMTPVLMFVLMFAIDYRLGILLILTTVIGVLQYRKMSGGTEFLSGYSAALQKMSAATVEYVRGMQIIKIFGVTVQYYKTLINSIKEYKQYVYQYSLSCKNSYVGFQVLFNVFYALDLGEFIDSNGNSYIDIVELNPISCSMCYVNNSIYADVVPEIGECQRQLMMGAEFCYDAIANPKNYDMLRISDKSYTYTTDNQYALL